MIGEDSELLTFPSAVAGWRAWVVWENQIWPTRLGIQLAAGEISAIEADSLLDPRYRRLTWKPVTADAFCTRLGHGHPVPQPDCECGWHAWREPGLAARFAQKLAVASELDNAGGVGMIWGAICGGGVVCCHHLGFRSQRAQILGLVRPAWMSDQTSQAVSDSLGADLWVAGAEALARVVEDSGAQPVPRELRYSSGRWNRASERIKDVKISLGLY